MSGAPPQYTGIFGGMYKGTAFFGFTSVVLLLSHVGMVGYVFMNDRTGMGSTGVNLLQSAFQVTSLVMLKVKVCRISDAMSLLSSFVTKCLLLHASFLAIRVVAHLITNDVYGVLGSFWIDFSFFFLCCLILIVACRVEPNKKNLAQHRDVWWILAFPVLATFLQAVIIGLEPGFPVTLVVATHVINYIQILAFTPALWTLYQMDAKVEAFQVLDNVGQLRAFQQQVIAVSVFLVGFYLYEDILSLPAQVSNNMIMFGACFLHMVILVDISLFFFYRAYFACDATMAQQDSSKMTFEQLGSFS